MEIHMISGLYRRRMTHEDQPWRLGNENQTRCATGDGVDNEATKITAPGRKPQSKKKMMIEIYWRKTMRQTYDTADRAILSHVLVICLVFFVYCVLPLSEYIIFIWEFGISDRFVVQSVVMSFLPHFFCLAPNGGTVEEMA